MEFEIEKGEMNEILNNINGFYKEEIVGMEVNGNNIKIFSLGDNSYFEQTSGKVNILQEGKVFFDLNIFVRIIKSLPDDLIKIKKEENIIKISSGKCFFNLRTSNPYKCSVKINPEIIMNFDTNNIIEAINKTNFIADKNNFVLTYIFIKNNDISFIGANPHILGFYSFSESSLDNNSEIELCILQENFKSIYNVLKRNTEHRLDIGIDYKNNLILFSINNILMVIKNNPPRIKKMNEMRDKFIINDIIEVEIDKQSIFSGIKQLIPLIEEDDINNKLLFTFDNGKLSISDHTGEGSVVLLEDSGIMNYRICLNNKFIYEILKNNKTNKVIFKFPANDNEKPIILCCQDDFSEYIVAPIRV